jgi:uncharacterized protein YjbJ (UPF0337 family)
MKSADALARELLGYLIAGSPRQSKKAGKELFMHWNQLEGNWKQLKGSIKQKWGKLTDNDIEYIAGKRDKFAGKLQERYGLAKEQAEKQADEWISALQGMDVEHEQHSGARR